VLLPLTVLYNKPPLPLAMALVILLPLTLPLLWDILAEDILKPLMVVVTLLLMVDMEVIHKV
jgi:hypothetical protein